MLRAIAAFFLLAGMTAWAGEAEPSFRNQVQPILARYGCSAGACHGAAAGQGGFKLSLRGYDDDGDCAIITKSAQGRRVCLEDPARSLLLLKATKAVPHKGGERFKPDSPEYAVLANWIAHGCPEPRKEDPRIEKIEIALTGPRQILPSQSQPLQVMATFSNGAREDVTRWAKYTAGNTSVATVDENGMVKVEGHGAGTITAWYLSRLATVEVISPYPQQPGPEAFATLTPRGFIDQRILEKLQELHLPPSPRCTDGEFIRRAFLDTIGVLPTAAETRTFLGDTMPEKRDRLITTLLQRPEFVDYWAYKWSDLLLVNSDKLPVQPMWSYYQWIRRQVELNTPWDVLVRDLLTATGSTLQNGAGNFFTLHDEPTKLAETVSVAFLGMSINCAKCHNHPMEKWTNDQYYAFANLFSRVRSKNGSVPDERVVFADASGDLVQPLRGKPQPPTPLDGTPLSLTAPEDRREPMARWLTAPENPYFARSITNRVWKNFFAVGLVESVDDLRMTNPASNEKLLSEAAAFLIEKKFDLRALIQAILQSETYQRSSVALAGNGGDTRFYARYYPRRLMAEVMLDAISQVSQVPTAFRMDKRNANRGLGDSYPTGYRALQLPDSNTASYFLTSFGRPDRVQTCSCERTNEPSMAQALHLANGDTLNQKLSEPGNRLAADLASKQPDAALLENIWLSAMSRQPTEKEATAAARELSSGQTSAERRAALEDIYWSLLSSREFLFNH